MTKNHQAYRSCNEHECGTKTKPSEKQGRGAKPGTAASYTKGIGVMRKASANQEMSQELDRAQQSSIGEHRGPELHTSTELYLTSKKQFMYLELMLMLT
jgi:hypothetical protein